LTVNETQGAFAGQVEERVPEQAGKRQVRIGMFAIAGLLATVYLLFLLTDPATFRGRYKITTTVDNAMGLRTGDPVQMRGVTIGSVNDFELGGEAADVVIILEIDGQWIIPEGSTTQLVQPGLMAPRTVEVLPGPGPGTMGRGDNLPGFAVKGLLDDTESLGEKGQLVLDRITELLSPENLDAFGGSAEGLNTLLADLSDLMEAEKDNVSELIESLNGAAGGLEDMTADGAELGEDLANAVAKADSLMDRLNATTESVGSTVASLQTILARMENGEGTLGRLSVSDTLYTDLSAAIESARLLMDDLRENPGRYINVSIF
jgi:phospholipid/cholesterol/gamma-HCH transport system substrate-binding protein